MPPNSPEALRYEMKALTRCFSSRLLAILGVGTGTNVLRESEARTLPKTPLSPATAPASSRPVYRRLSFLN